MKKQIASNRFAQYYFETETGLLEQVWTNKMALMTVPEYKTESLFFKKLIQDNQYKFVLADLVDFNFIIVPELQDWVDQNITMQIAQIIQKIAFVLPQDIFTVVAVEQTLDTEAGNREQKKIAHFADIESAKNWLLKR